jgi:hypothetical protein
MQGRAGQGRAGQAQSGTKGRAGQGKAGQGGTGRVVGAVRLLPAAGAASTRGVLRPTGVCGGGGGATARSRVHGADTSGLGWGVRQPCGMLARGCRESRHGAESVRLCTTRARPTGASTLAPACHRRRQPDHPFPLPSSPRSPSHQPDAAKHQHCTVRSRSALPFVVATAGSPLPCLHNLQELRCRLGK